MQHVAYMHPDFESKMLLSIHAAGGSLPAVSAAYAEELEKIAFLGGRLRQGAQFLGDAASSLARRLPGREAARAAAVRRRLNLPGSAPPGPSGARRLAGAVGDAASSAYGRLAQGARGAADIIGRGGREGAILARQGAEALGRGASSASAALGRGASSAADLAGRIGREGAISARQGAEALGRGASSAADLGSAAFGRIAQGAGAAADVIGRGAGAAASGLARGAGAAGRGLSDAASTLAQAGRATARDVSMGAQLLPGQAAGAVGSAVGGAQNLATGAAGLAGRASRMPGNLVESAQDAALNIRADVGQQFRAGRAGRSVAEQKAVDARAMADTAREAAGAPNARSALRSLPDADAPQPTSKPKTTPKSGPEDISGELPPGYPGTDRPSTDPLEAIRTGQNPNAGMAPDTGAQGKPPGDRNRLEELQEQAQAKAQEQAQSRVTSGTNDPAAEGAIPEGEMAAAGQGFDLNKALGLYQGGEGSAMFGDKGMGSWFASLTPEQQRNVMATAGIGVGLGGLGAGVVGSRLLGGGGSQNVQVVSP